MAIESHDGKEPIKTFGQRVASLRTEAENFKQKEGDLNKYAEQLTDFMNRWFHLWGDIDSVIKSVGEEEGKDWDRSSDEERARISELHGMSKALYDLRYETSHLITDREASKLLYEKFISQKFDGVHVETESGEFRSTSSEASYEAAMQLLRNPKIDHNLLYPILNAASLSGAHSIDVDGVERIWGPLSYGSDVDSEARIGADRTWIKGHPDVAVRVLDIRLLSFEKGLFGESHDVPTGNLDRFLLMVDTYDLVNAVPQNQREYYRNEVEKWRKKKRELDKE